MTRYKEPSDTIREDSKIGAKPAPNGSLWRATPSPTSPPSRSSFFACLALAVTQSVRPPPTRAPPAIRPPHLDRAAHRRKSRQGTGQRHLPTMRAPLDPRIPEAPARSNRRPLPRIASFLCSKVSSDAYRRWSNNRVLLRPHCRLIPSLPCRRAFVQTSTIGSGSNHLDSSSPTTVRTATSAPKRRMATITMAAMTIHLTMRVAPALPLSIDFSIFSHARNAPRASRSPRWHRRRCRSFTRSWRT